MEDMLFKYGWSGILTIGLIYLFRYVQKLTSDWMSSEDEARKREIARTEKLINVLERCNYLLEKNDTTVQVGAGCGLGDLIYYCRKEELGGIEFLAGIPGTIGGAVVMNAGAFGKEISSRIVSIELMNSKAENELFERDQLNFSYRSCEIASGSVIVGCSIKLDKVPREEFSKLLRGYLRKRKETQPLEYPSAGSVFKNPPGDYAGRLIEASGLKGKKIGGAMISEKHANFIINTGGAKAKDVIALIKMARDTVKQKTKLELETEIKIIGS